jgi:hypothetical protein
VTAQESLVSPVEEELKPLYRDRAVAWWDFAGRRETGSWSGLPGLRIVSTGQATTGGQ